MAAAICGFFLTKTSATKYSSEIAESLFLSKTFSFTKSLHFEKAAIPMITTVKHLYKFTVLPVENSNNVD